MSNIDNFRKAAKEARIYASGVIKKREFTALKYNLKEITIELGEGVARGQNVEVYRPAGLDDLYGRKNLCLKVFTNSETVWGHPRGVGQSPILESTMVQNLMSLRGLAPRVYDVVKVNGRTAQVTDYIEGQEGVVPIADDRFKIDPAETKTDYNFIGGKLVDFQGSVFKDYEGYAKSVYERAIRGTKCRGSSNGAYQSSDAFTGFRDTKERLKKYQFADFGNKLVLDIGCNYGMMSRAAVDLGAKRVVGIDWPDVVAIARELAIIEGYFNIDFIGADLRKITYESIQHQSGIERFDVHLFLAVENWIGWPEWVKNCDTLYYEGHGENRAYEVRKYREEKKS